MIEVSALFLNILGTLGILWSFEPTSSDFRLISADGVTARAQPYPGAKAYAVCADQQELASVDTTQNVSVGTGDCRLWDRGHPVAIVLSDEPKLLRSGLALLGLGFFLQLLLAVL